MFKVYMYLSQLSSLSHDVRSYSIKYEIKRLFGHPKVYFPYCIIFTVFHGVPPVFWSWLYPYTPLSPVNEEEKNIKVNVESVVQENVTIHIE